MDVVAVGDVVFEKNIVALSKKLSEMLGKSSTHYQQKLRRAKKLKNSSLRNLKHYYSDLALLISNDALYGG